ncbi:helix-turn-helix domain-containing protein [Mammaliicoccus sciuri]
MELTAYIPIATFLYDFLGTDAEIILTDTVKSKVVFVRSTYENHVQVGDSIRDIEQRFIDKKIYEEKNSIINYRAFTIDKKKLRSASFFIKDENHDLTGILTINYQVDELVNFRDLINKLISGSNEKHSKEESFHESFNLSFDDLMTSTIQDALTTYNIPPDRLSHEEKMELIRTLDKKGTFLIKGSVPELAKILNTSETTIYRYINKL